MNWERIILGGLVAGLVINVSEGALHDGVRTGEANPPFSDLVIT